MTLSFKVIPAAPYPVWTLLDSCPPYWMLLGSGVSAVQLRPLPGHHNPHSDSVSTFIILSPLLEAKHGVFVLCTNVS
jgi:hypothetical protein